MQTIEYYNRNDINDIMEQDYEAAWLTGIRVEALVGKIEGQPEAAVHALPSLSCAVIITDAEPTGVGTMLGTTPVIVLNEADMLHYDLMSELHPIKDCAGYILIDQKWDATDWEQRDLGVHGEWWRSDVYTDNMPAYGTALNWPDKVEESND